MMRGPTSWHEAKAIRGALMDRTPARVLMTRKGAWFRCYVDACACYSRKMMRSVSFVDRLELEFPGNHSFHGLCLGDVDGDGVRIRSHDL